MRSFQAGVLGFIIGLFVAAMLDAQVVLTTDWKYGSEFFTYSESYPYQVGFRSDGIVIWRTRPVSVTGVPQ